MDWIDDGMKAFRAQRSEAVAIKSSATRVFEALWAAIVEVVESANEHGTNLIPNGEPNRRVIRMVYDPPGGSQVQQPRLLTVELAADSRSIVATFDGARHVFTVAVRAADGVVVLMAARTSITAQEAAKQVMQEFLFAGNSPYAVRASGVPD